MMEGNQINTSPLYPAMTRPPMLFGVTMNYFVFALAMTVVAFNLFGLRYISIYLPLHIIGALLCLIDQNIFSVIAKYLECHKTPNKRLWGSQSYEPF